MPSEKLPKHPVRGYRPIKNPTTSQKKILAAIAGGEAEREAKMMVHDETRIAEIIDAAEGMIFGEDAKPLNVPLFVQGMVGMYMLKNSLLNSMKVGGKRHAYERLRLILDGLCFELDGGGLPVEKLLCFIPTGKECTDPDCDCKPDGITNPINAMLDGLLKELERFNPTEDDGAES